MKAAQQEQCDVPPFTRSRRIPPPEKSPAAASRILVGAPTGFGSRRGGAPIGAGGHDPPLFEAKGAEGHDLGIIHISHIALITPLH